MKKWITLLLAALLCLPLMACGGSSPEKAMGGAWNRENGYDVLLFTDDGKVTRGSDTYDWWYDKGAERYCLSLAGLTYTFVIEEDETGRFFSVEGIRYRYVENYDPEALKAAYIEKQIGAITSGKTEMKVGASYTTASGITFTLDRVELTGEDATFNLYLTAEKSVEMEDAHYFSFHSNSHFGMGWQPEGSEGTTHRYAGCCFRPISEVKADKDTYGFLSFAIEGVTYYLPIATFVAG